MQQICLVTGGTSGIGRATAYIMAKRGYTVVVVGRNNHKCMTTVAEIKNKITANRIVKTIFAENNTL